MPSKPFKEDVIEEKVLAWAQKPGPPTAKAEMSFPRYKFQYKLDLIPGIADKVYIYLHRILSEMTNVIFFALKRADRAGIELTASGSLAVTADHCATITARDQHILK